MVTVENHKHAAYGTRGRDFFEVGTLRGLIYETLCNAALYKVVNLKWGMRKMRIVTAFAAVFLLFVLSSCQGLLHSAKVNDVNGIQKSLDGGMPIEHRNDVGRTALIIAAYSRSAEAVELLCKRGADVNAKDNPGCTALLYAAYYNAPDVAETLLRYGADQTITDRYGKTPLDYAEEYNYPRLVTLLKGTN